MALKKSQKIFACLFLVVILSSCSGLDIRYVMPEEEKGNYYLQLNSKTLFIGTEMEDTSSYVNCEKQHYVQELGHYDFYLEEGKITRITTACKKVYLADTFYVGQSKLELESYTQNLFTYKSKDKTIYYDNVSKVGLEVIYEQDMVSVISMVSMELI